MADLNALIAQGAQFRQPDSPLNMMAQLQTFQQGQSANQLNQLKIAEAQRDMEEANALRRLDPTSASYLEDVMKVSPEKGFAFAKLQREAKTAGTESQIKDVKLLTDKLATIPEMYKRASTPEDFLAIHQSVHSDPVIGPWLNSIGATPDKGLATLQTAAQTPDGLEQYRQKAMSSVGQILESAKPMVVSPGASVYAGGKFTQAPAGPAAPSDVSRLIAERKALPPGDPNISNYDAAIRKATTFAPQAVTNIRMAPLEGSEQKEKGILNVGQYKDVSAAAKLAAKTLPAIDTNLNILNKGFETGFGTETVAAGAKVLAALGVPNAETFATNAQVFKAKATEAVLQKQLEQKGPQTESDAQRIDQIGAQLGKTTQGNKFLLTTAKEQLKRDMEQRNFYDAWWKQNKTYEGAEDAWYAGEGGKSLFDRPVLKSYIKSTEPTPTAGKPSLDKIFSKRP